MSDDDLEDPLTTGQTALVVGVSEATVKNLFDEGELDGWRITRHRRITVSSIRRFMRQRKMPEHRLDLFLEARSQE